MESWFKAKAAEVANAAAQAAETAAKKAGIPLDDVAAVGLTTGAKDLEFITDSLGFDLEGALVRSVDGAGEAAKLGVVPGDQLFAISGYVVPEDEDEREQAKTINKWLREAGRPVRLTFRVAPSPEEDVAVIGDDAICDLPLEEQAFDVGVCGSASEKQVPIALKVVEQDVTQPVPNDSVGGQDETVLASERGSVVLVPEPSPRCETGETGDTRQEATEISQECADVGMGLEAGPEDVQEVPKGEVDTLRAKLQKEHAKRKQVSTELLAARQIRLRMGAELEAERRTSVAAQQQIIDLQAQLATLSEKCQQLDRELASGEEDDRIFRDTQGAREGVLEDEVNRLRGEIMAAEERSREASDLSSLKISRLEESIAHHVDESRRLVARAVEAESRMETAERELRRAHERSAADQAKFAEALSAEESKNEALLKQLAECERRTAEEIDKLKFRLNEYREKEQLQSEKKREDDEEDGDEETGKPLVTEFAKYTSSADSSSEVLRLRERLEMLEARCGEYQRKLNSRPIVFQKPASDADGARSGGGLAMQWEPKLRSAVGPHFAALVLRLYSAPDRVLRKFTQRLLEHDAWLWLFYMHLVVLYTIVASYHSQTMSSHSSSPVDVLNKHLKAAQNAP